MAEPAAVPPPRSTPPEPINPENNHLPNEPIVNSRHSPRVNNNIPTNNANQQQQQQPQQDQQPPVR